VKRDGLFLKGSHLNSLYGLPILFFSIVVHEIAHGWTALRLGDPTARDSGRLTFNPIPHIDLIGSIIVPLLSYISVHTVFIAWAKPVPVNPAYFRNYRRDDILVSFAGPFSNLLMAFCCTIFYIGSIRFLPQTMSMGNEFYREIVVFVINMFETGITLNIFLAVFNLIPVPPLDGSHILSSILPEAIGERYRQIGFFGILIVILLMQTKFFQNIVISFVMALRLPLDILIRLLS
jgi:Zn-dependent protease